MSTDAIMQQVTEVLVQNVNISIVIICLVIGAILKHAVKNFNNDWIPVVLIVIGIGLSFVIAVLNKTTNDPVNIIIVGIASAVAAVGLHQAGKTLYLYTAKNSDDKKE